MTPERWERIRSILDEALDRPVDERNAFVEMACEKDTSLHDDVLDFLAQHAAADKADFLLRIPNHIDSGNNQSTAEKSQSTDPFSLADTGAWLSDIKQDDTNLSTQIPTGALRGGRFEIQREYARGGLGIVYIAHDHELDREVAVKEMQDRFFNDPAAYIRFTREAEITGRLEHPGIAPVYSFGEYEDGRPFYAMKLVAGENMAEAIKRFHQRNRSKEEFNYSETTRLSHSDYMSFKFKQLLGHFLSLCNTIEYAHKKGYIHRDIKPENVHLGNLGETIVLDWGLAKSLDNSDGNNPSSEFFERNSKTRIPSDLTVSGPMTRYGDVFGTPAYMSPEQATGDIKQLSPRSDIFSLGATFYCLLVGEPPMLRKESDTVQDILARLRNGDWIRPRERSENIPRPLNAICNKAMALAPKDRYSSAGALAEDIERYLADEPTSVWVESFGERLLRWQRRYPGLRTGLILAITILVVSVVGLSWLAINLNTAKRIAHDEADRANREAQRAVHAESATQKEASKGYVINLARLAQRGDWKSVLNGLDSSLLDHFDDPIILQLWRIEALQALNQMDDVFREVEVLAASNDYGSHAGEAELWIGDVLRMRGIGHPDERIQRAIQLGLPPADLAYAQALVASTIPESIEWLKKAIDKEPFHLRANSLLTIYLILSGHHDEAKARANAATNLFPEDPYFPAILALAAFFDGNQAEIEYQLTNLSRLADDEYANRLRQVLKTTHSIIERIDQESISKLGLLIDIPKVISEWKTLGKPISGGRSINIQLPPQLHGLLAKLISALQSIHFSNLFNMDSQKSYEKAARQFGEVANILPIAEFLTLHGFVLIEAGQRDQGLRVLEQAIQAPELLTGSHRKALEAACISYLNIYYFEDRHSEKSKLAYEKGYALLERYIDLGDPDTHIFSPTILILLDNEMFRLRGHHILERAYHQDPKRHDLAHLLALSHMLLGNHYRALQFAKEALQQDPNNDQAKQVRDKSQKILNKWYFQTDGKPPEPATPR